MGENLYWIWLSRCCLYNSGTIDRLYRIYKSPRVIYETSMTELEEALGGKNADLVRMQDKDLSDAQRIMDFCMISDVGILTYSDPAYPARLRLLPDAPPVLYYKGKLPPFDGRLLISVIGTRWMSEYGKRMSFEIAYDLARAGTIVVTGMALGIDGVASAAALAAGGKTIAVLGSGIDIVYPSEHQYLMNAIAKRGLVITEFAPGTPPEKRNFPRRNRIISGLAQGVLVIEGNERSGALITARLAAQQGRDVYALPGNADEENSHGTTLLLKNGAHPVSCADDIIKRYESLYGNRLNIFNLLKPTTANVERVISTYRVSASKKAPAHHHKDKMRVEQAAPPVAESKPIKHTPKAEKTPPVKPSPINEEKLSKLDESFVTVYRAMPTGKAVTIDEICATGISAGQVMTALTMLELNKLVSSLPGGRYIRV
ncbi:MAG: DNA-processing protein DprA [Clostridia bacterium]|nr:DNA-processing protein DprA [Clostridia bacterium]